MPENYLTHDFNRHPATACMGGGIASEIVGSQMYSDQVTGLSDNHPSVVSRK